MQHARPPHLPFRRISLPSAPSQLNRQSVVSMASFDSLPEEGNASGAPTSAVNKSPSKKSRSRPSSMEPQKKVHRKREVRPVNEAKLAKRAKVIEEFYETERTYVQGLDLIYSHFLTPIIAALDTPQPLLDRAELTSVFSNFIDIWNFHRSFFSSLTEHLHPSSPNTTSTNQDNLASSQSQSQSQSQPPVPLSPVLLSHFPYLSLYTPFVTSFHESISSLTGLLNSNAVFSAFVAKQEADPRCGKLKLRDWLLTIVQRCPRYLLLLKDLINCTDPDDPECQALMAAHSLVSKITISLNSSLNTHAQTLALLSLQRSTPNLPFQLISPGRTFLKRGTLLQFERSSLPKEREFLLFSDCLIWLANLDRGDGELAERWDWMAGGNAGGGAGGGGPNGKGRPHGRPQMLRSRSRSEAELSALSERMRNSSPLPSPSSPPSAKRSQARSPARPKKRQASSGTGEEKWWFKGKAELVDVEVVVSPGEETRFEILSPEGSFAVYAAGPEEREEWSTAIRNAKAALLVSLNATHPNSTLTSSASNQHIRRMLQALPHLPEEDDQKPKRGKVEHFVPPVWIPDGKTESCMRCARTFGWRRRRHHCRLCGRKDASKPARACDACYETVFPIIDPSASPHVPPPTFTLTGFPSWQSMPALAMPGARPRPASALMAIDLGPKRALSRIDDAPTPAEFDDCGGNGSGGGTPPRPVIRVKPPSRPRSFHQILEDFHGHARKGEANNNNGNGHENRNGNSHENGAIDLPLPSPAGSHFSVRTGSSTLDTAYLSPSSAAHEFPQSPTALSCSPSQSSHDDSRPPTPRAHARREDTARRHKRFSMPAVGLHTAPVTARPNTSGEGLAKRFSLVLGGRSSRAHRGHGQEAQGNGNGNGHGQEDGKDRMPPPPTLRHGAAAVKLGELLGRKRSTR
ncbi:hypothetical protein DENSPDRAFT_578152 [Dentipellis sp. KUC8613]|nr:hypothetical protein DENSPDRAFT_578152 [Dentipellis sp. KUC8613]